MQETASQEAPATVVAHKINANTPENKRAFLAALAKAQGEYEEVKKNAHVAIRPRDSAAYEFDYADLGELLGKTRKALSGNGLSVRMVLSDHDGDTVWLNSILGHAEGYEDVSSMCIQTGGDIKQFGGRITYLRRYLLGPQLGVAGEGDLEEDGRAVDDVASGASVQITPKKTEPARRQKATSSPAPAPRNDGPPPDAPPPAEFTQAPPPPAPQPSPPQASAPAPEPASASDTAEALPAGVKKIAEMREETGEFASVGECNYLLRTITTRRVDFAGLLQALQLPADFSAATHANRQLEGNLTKAQWKVLMSSITGND